LISRRDFLQISKLQGPKGRRPVSVYCRIPILLVLGLLIAKKSTTKDDDKDEKD
jgi:hypothetical protein